MLELTVTLIPNGNRAEARVIARGTIRNVGTAADGTGNYKCSFSKRDEPDVMGYSGQVIGYDRAQSPWHLLLLALGSAVGRTLIRPNRQPKPPRAVAP